MKKYNEVQCQIIQISSEDIVTASITGGGLGGGFGGEEQTFTPPPSTQGMFYENE